MKKEFLMSKLKLMALGLVVTVVSPLAFSQGSSSMMSQQPETKPTSLGALVS